MTERKCEFISLKMFGFVKWNNFPWNTLNIIVWQPLARADLHIAMHHSK